MLVSLFLSNYLYIEKLSISFQKGLNVIIGESGSGKSIVIEGLLLALGAKLQTGNLSKSDSEPMIFSAEFSQPSSPIKAYLSDKGVHCDELIIIRRVVTKDRKSRYYLNDMPVAQELVKGLSSAILEYTGQSANFALLSRATHIKLLDTKVLTSEQITTGRELYSKYRELDKRYKSLLERYDNIVIEREYLEHAVKEISELEYTQGEEELLVEKRKILSDQKALIETIHKVQSFLSDAGTVESLIRLKKDLSKNLDYFDATTIAIDNTIDALDKIESELNIVSEKIQFTSSLEEVEDRLYKIRAIAKKYQTLPASLAEKLAQFEAEAAVINNIDAELESTKSELDGHISNCFAHFKVVSQKRHDAASILEVEVNKNLAELRLDKASFKCDITSEFALPHFSENGFDSVEFLFKTIPSKPYESLATVASGGELSRIVLALKLALSTASEVSSMIFDEIDTGISGQTAISVADKLKDLSESVQLITITHQPYLAAKADNLIYFEKSSNDNDLSLNFKTLNEQEREQAIAKMISGDKISEDTISAAKSLINL
jgi:DNA repair protein RecN (Recombination protein N)